MIPQIETPLGKITIRVAVREDAPAILDLRLEALSSHPESFAADVEKTTQDGVQAWENIISNYEKDHSGSLILACAAEKLVGMLGVVRGHWPKTSHNAALWGVYVQPASRGFHIAEGMIDMCIAWAVTNNVSVLYLGVTTININAIRFYTRCGFNQYGIEPRVIYFDGVYYDQILMAKLIQPPAQ